MIIYLIDTQDSFTTDPKCTVLHDQIAFLRPSTFFSLSCYVLISHILMLKKDLKTSLNPDNKTLDCLFFFLKEQQNNRISN